MILVMLAAGSLVSACTTADEGVSAAQSSTEGDSGYSGDSESASPPNGAEAPEQVVRISITGGETEPSGARVEVRGDQPVIFDVTADEAGELGVHTSTEQSLAYGAGRTRVVLPALERPGIYEVENHDLDVTIVQLAVTS